MATAFLEVEAVCRRGTRARPGWDRFYVEPKAMLLTGHHIRDVVVLTLEGAFDARTAPSFAEWLETAMRSGASQVVVNMQSVSFMDSAGLATLVRFMKQCRGAGGDLCLANLQRPVRMIFELTRLDKAFRIYPTVDAAAESFAVGRPA